MLYKHKTGRYFSANTEEEVEMQGGGSPLAEGPVLAFQQERDLARKLEGRESEKKGEKMPWFLPVQVRLLSEAVKYLISGDAQAAAPFLQQSQELESSASAPESGRQGILKKAVKSAPASVGAVLALYT